ncbi:hypothetical protein MOMUL_20880 [Moorella mulderi DSM 14980]|uniref:Uncharacterized protein n=1 Tax=Moorella mulderi DSM 14980 TaxID=1122241 RepID=A0A151AVP2_9FIRM|nr:hypothetical protein MOMUL_20880 [Moorella mulderi DSM 14980]
MVISHPLRQLADPGRRLTAGRPGGTSGQKTASCPIITNGLWVADLRPLPKRPAGPRREWARIFAPEPARSRAGPERGPGRRPGRVEAGGSGARAEGSGRRKAPDKRKKTCSINSLTHETLSPAPMGGRVGVLLRQADCQGQPDLSPGSRVGRARPTKKGERLAGPRQRRVHLPGVPPLPAGKAR